MSKMLLEVDQLTAGYGGYPVLKGISFRIPCAQSLGLIGPNGCGKSTLLRALVAEIPEINGDILFQGQHIARLETDVIIGRGIAYLRQTRNIFPGLSVADNLELAAMNGKQCVARPIESVMKAFPVLKGRESVRAGLMSGGERQALAVAMVLMHQVSLLLLDEPLAGLSPKIAGEILHGIQQLQSKEGFAMIMVEHRLTMIRPYLDRIIVMTQGRIAEDTDDTSLLENREALEKHFLA